MTSEIYKISPSRLAATITRYWLADYWWTLVIAPAIALMVGAMGDTRFLLVALILIFLVIPPAVFFIYFYYGLSPAARFSILPHRIEANDNGLTFTFYHPDDTESENGHTPTSTETIVWHDIKSVATDSETLTFRLGNGSYSFILLPASALSDTGDPVKWRSYAARHIADAAFSHRAG